MESEEAYKARIAKAAEDWNKKWGKKKKKKNNAQKRYKKYLKYEAKRRKY